MVSDQPTVVERPKVGVVGFHPTRATWIALATVPAMWAVYFANTRWTETHPIWALLVYFVVGNIVLATLVPALVVCRDGGLSRLGFTRTKLWWAVGVSVFLSAGAYLRR